MDKPIVKCSVANCNYWNEGNNCSADLIMIDIDQHSNTHYDTEFAGEGFDSKHQDSAASARYTCCHTFELRK